MNPVVSNKKIDKIKKAQVNGLFFKVLLAIFAILVVVRDINSLAINKYAFVVLALVICTFCDVNSLLCLLAFMVPLHSAVCGTYITGIVLIFYIFRFKKNNALSGSFLWVLALLVLELLSGARYDFSFGYYLKFACNFIALFYIALDSKKIHNAHRILKYFILGFFVALFSLWGQLFQQYSFSEVMSLKFRFGEMNNYVELDEGMRVSFNSNDLGFICVLVALFSLMLIKQRKKKIFAVPFVISSLTLVMTMSRGAVLAYVTGLILYLILSSNNIGKLLRNIAIVVLIIAALLFLFSTLFPELWEAFLMRFNEEDITNGRSIITSYYFDALFSNPLGLLIGVGLQYYNVKYNYPFSCHNAIQEILVAWGVVGLIIIIILFIRGIQNTKSNNPKFKKFQVAPLAALLVGFQTGQCFSGYPQMLYLLLCFIAFYLEY